MHTHLPGWLYESLPYLYIAASVVVAVSLDNAWGNASALLLLVAGLMVWWVRRVYRQASRAVPARPEPSAVSDESGLERMVWSREFECGHSQIDAQHRRLFEQCELLRRAILERRPKLDLELMLDELVNDIGRHFSFEEMMLIRERGALTTEHMDAHGMLLLRSRQMAARYHGDEVDMDQVYRYISSEVVAGHILRLDRHSAPGPLAYPPGAAETQRG